MSREQERREFRSTRKRCYRCTTAGHAFARNPVPGDTEECSYCHGRVWFFGERMTRTLWPHLPEEGPDTLDAQGNEVPGAWEQNVAAITDPRWRR